MTYDVLVEEDGTESYQATILGWPGWKSAGSTREQALENLRGKVKERLRKAELVKLEIELPDEHPWVKLASLDNNPLFDEVQESIEAFRRELDAEEAM